MVLTTTEASYIIVLCIVISVLPISSTLLQDGYHVYIKQYSKQKRTGANHLLKTNLPNELNCILMAFPMAFPFPIPIAFLQSFPSIPRLLPQPFLISILRPLPTPLSRPLPRLFLRPFPSPVPIIRNAEHWTKKAGLRSGFVKQWASSSAVGMELKSISRSLARSAAR